MIYEIFCFYPIHVDERIRMRIQQPGFGLEAGLAMLLDLIVPCVTVDEQHIPAVIFQQSRSQLLKPLPTNLEQLEPL